ncbi:twin transmembrane helix small protein [Rhodoferax lacus]|uniref:Twin transmembrane helix small protein n=2 Tax=Rhodoferax lacus TaxID=2184758 RepID=A0A3E1RGB0_9BURK|nr:twin transmembrane helix small protein [Rhodoferax lacus]
MLTMSYLVALAFLAIIASLGAALFFMLRGGQAEAPDKSKRMARALAMRVGFSVLLFVCMLVSWKMGWVHPTGIAAGQ